MKWKPITELPSELIDEDLLLRIVYKDRTVVAYAVASIDANGDIYTFDDDFGSEMGDYCNIHLAHRWNAISIHFIDPKEISL